MMRFKDDAIATEGQRKLLRRLTTDDNPLAADPALTANDAWRLCGQHLECEGDDARVLAFFGEDPNTYNQTSGEDRAAWLLSDVSRARRWADHPRLDEATMDAIHQALDSVEAWGLRNNVFYLPHMADFDVHRMLQFEAEVLAWKLQCEGQTARVCSLRRMVRQAMTQRLRDFAKNPQSQGS